MKLSLNQKIKMIATNEEKADLATLTLQNTLGVSKGTDVEWDDCTEQFLLAVDRKDFMKFPQIKECLTNQGLYVDEFTNGHGFIRPVSVARKMDLQLEVWYYTLIG
jgi:hypothetical protein